MAFTTSGTVGKKTTTNISLVSYLQGDLIKSR